MLVVIFDIFGCKINFIFFKVLFNVKDLIIMMIKKINSNGIIIFDVFFNFFLIFNMIIIIVVNMNIFCFRIVN